MLVQGVHLMHRQRDQFAGTVKFMFRPGEEAYGGARLMIKDGLVGADPKPDAAFALHIHPVVKAGAIFGKPGRSWLRPTPGRSRSRGVAVTPRCRTTRSIRCRSRSRSGSHCIPWSPAGSTSSIRSW